MTNLIWTLVQPSLLLLYGAVLGLVFLGRPWGRRVLVGTVAAFVVAVATPFSGLLLAPLEQRFPVAVPERVDGIVVLAGSEIAELSLLHGHPQLDRHGDRLTTFLLLANRFPNARLAHSGGTGDPHTDQSAPARALLLGAGLDPARIVFENESRNTCENARLSRERLQPRPDERWLLVTSAAHMPRSIACFRAVGWDVAPFPTDYQGDTSWLPIEVPSRLAALDYAVHEWLGLLYYRLRYTDELFPAPRS